jgi:hypothetical protein
MTRNDLYQIDQQIQIMQREQQAIALLLFNRINLFYEAAGHQLKITRGRFDAIKDKYVQKEDGVYLTHIVNGTDQWKFKGSMKDDNNVVILGEANVIERFNQECASLMQQIITIDSF